ncbi:MAG: hypothetical protein LUD79_03490 [Oscillospiraceae bacterium]|nr:hypothetical protein [Oscillospiraceae bacterium]
MKLTYIACGSGYEVSLMSRYVPLPHFSCGKGNRGFSLAGRHRFFLPRQKEMGLKKPTAR